MKKRLKMKKLKNKLETCFECSGDGYVDYWEDDMYGVTHHVGTFQCDCCHGEGLVNSLDVFKSEVRIGKVIKKIMSERKGDK